MILALSIASPAGSVTLPTGFGFENVVGLPFVGQTVGFTFLPDGRPLIIEKTGGNVRLAAVGSSVSVVIHNVPDVSIEQERGLIGVAVDPGWPLRPYLYFCYTHTSGTTRVSMFEAFGDLADPVSTTIVLGNPFLVFEFPDQTPLHNAGTLRFGPEGMLYVSTGEDLTACHSQNLAEPRGKLLRLSVANLPGAGPGPPPVTDLIPPGNPFPGPDPVEQLVFAWGLRNPFRFTIDPATGDIYLGDVGTFFYEEINRVSFASGGGENFGWPIREGFLPAPFGETCGETNPFTDPIYDFPHDPKFQTAVIGGPLYRTVPGGAHSFPAAYDGSYFFLEFYGQWIRRLVNTGGAWAVAPPVPGQPSPDNWAEGLALIGDLQEGPDGGIYVIAMGHPDLARGIYRIAPNLPTDVHLEIEPPARSILASAVPNPAPGGGADIAWEMPRAQRLSVRIYDVSGRLVRTVQPASPSAARGAARWDGNDEKGRPSPTGTYVFVIDGENGARTSGKLSLVR